MGLVGCPIAWFHRAQRVGVPILFHDTNTAITYVGGAFDIVHTRLSNLLEALPKRTRVVRYTVPVIVAGLVGGGVRRANGLYACIHTTRVVGADHAHFTTAEVSRADMPRLAVQYVIAGP